MRDYILMAAWYLNTIGMLIAAGELFSGLDLRAGLGNFNRFSAALFAVLLVPSVSLATPDMAAETLGDVGL